MDNLTKKWHESITTQAVKKLGRELTQNELKFITSREGYLALEMIDESVKDLSGEPLVEYLNSER